MPRAWASTSSAEKERPLAVQNFQVRGGASPVTHDGQPDGLQQIRDRVFLANPDLVEFLIADQRVGYVRERALDRLPVRNQRLLMLRFGQPQIAAKRSTRENWLASTFKIGTKISNWVFELLREMAR